MTDEENNTPTNQENNAPEFNQGEANGKRSAAFRILAVVVVIGVVAFGTYYFLVASKHQTTDDAYVAAEIAQVTPSVGGTVKEIDVKDTDKVKAGDVLVVIDDADTKLALARAQADYAKTEADGERDRQDYNRRQALLKSGSVSAEEVSDAAQTYKAAETSLAAMQAQVDQAKIDLGRTVIVSPVDGVIAKRQVELGQRVQVGVPLMSVVPNDMHVDANYKEVQLRKVQIGMPVELTADIYGGSVKYHGKVAGFSGGTGAAFSLIPAQNATGNWIKVVQRLPVRIDLDPKELEKHPLQVGLSVETDIDISGYKKDGNAIAQPAPAPAPQPLSNETLEPGR